MRRWDYRERQAWLKAWAPDEGGWTGLGPAEIGFTLEALGVSPDGCAEVLTLAAALKGRDIGANAGVARDYRIAVVQLDHAGRLSGRPIGVYDGCAVLIWTKTETDFRRRA